ncbi:hypothetical protein VTO42DRAFT_915 [Malbranchea cinnamomea]
MRDLYGLFHSRDILLCVADQISSPLDLYNLHLVNRTFYQCLFSPLHRRLVQVASPDGESWLHKAVNHDCLSLAKRLLDHGMDVSVLDRRGATALLNAAELGRSIEFLRLLVDHGIDIDARSPLTGVNAMFAAVYHGHEHVVSFLLSAGARDIYWPAYGIWSPLTLAANQGRVEWLDIFCEHGVDLAFDLGGSRTLLHLAAVFGRLDFVRKLLDLGVDIETRSVGDYSPLWWAAHVNKKTQAQVVLLLLERGAKVYSRTPTDGSPETLLHAVARFGHEATAEVLLRYGMPVDLYSSWGFTPLHEAIKSRRLRMMQLLVDWGADVNAKVTTSGLTTLHVAARQGVPFVRLLLENGADPNKLGRYSKSVLHRAAFLEPDVVQLLLDYGADPNIKNNNGQTPLEVAKSFNCSDVIAKLLQQRAVDAPKDEGETAENSG